MVRLNFDQIRADALTASPAQISEAIDWFHDCQFDGLEEITFTPYLAVQGIERFYVGGWEQFLSDGQPVTTEEI